MKFLLFAFAILLTACQKPAELTYQIVSARPHDPECYTQGLEFSGGCLLVLIGGLPCAY